MRIRKDDTMAVVIDYQEKILGGNGRERGTFAKIRDPFEGTESNGDSDDTDNAVCPWTGK